MRIGISSISLTSFGLGLSTFETCGVEDFEGVLFEGKNKIIHFATTTETTAKTAYKKNLPFFIHSP